MAYPTPIVAKWPDMDSGIEFPETKKLPLVNKHDSTSKQVWDWLTKRSEYKLTEDYFQYVPVLKSWVFVPNNFVYDCASIPRVFGFILRPDGILSYGALPHDFGYRFGGLMLSAGPGHPYQFVKLGKRTIDKVFTNLNNCSHNISFINGIAGWAVETFAPFNPIDIEEVDWSKPVRRDYPVLV